MTKTEAIREELTKNFRQPAKELQATLASRGLEVELGLIYMVRSKINLEAKVAALAAPVPETSDELPRLNEKSLRAFIKQSLIGNDKGLSNNEIQNEVIRLGYHFSGNYFHDSIRKKIREMLAGGELEKLSRGQMVFYRLSDQMVKGEPLDAAILVHVRQLCRKIGLETVEEIIDNSSRMKAAIMVLKQVEAL